MEIKTLGKSTHFCPQGRLKLKPDITNSIKRNLKYNQNSERITEIRLKAFQKWGSWTAEGDLKEREMKEIKYELEKL